MNQFWRASALTGVALFLETCTFYLVFTIFTSLAQLPGARLPFWLVFLTLLWAFVLSLYLQTIRFSLNLRGSMGLAASFISILILSNLNTSMGFLPIRQVFSGGLQIAFTLVFTWVFLIVLWWRGASVAHDDVTLDSIRTTFQWGLAAVFVAVLIDGLTPLDTANGFLVLGYFAVGLAGLSLARFSSESGDSRIMSGNWLLPIGAAVGVVLLSGLLISGLGLGGLDDVTRFILGMVGTVGSWILKPILLGLGFIAAGLVAFGNWLTSIFGGGDLSGLLEAQRQLQDFHDSLEVAERNGPPRLLVELLKGIAFLIGSVIAGWILFRLFRFRRLLRESGEVEETRESMFSWDRVNRDLSAWFNDWWNRLAQGVTREERRLPEPRDPREVYHRFLGLAEQVGHPRGEGQTPREHQRYLGTRLPPAPVGQVVDRFQETYYGDHSFGSPEMARLLTDWTSLQQYVAEEQRRASESDGESDSQSDRDNGSGSAPRTS